MKINLDNVIDFSQGGSKKKLPHFRAVSTIAPNVQRGVAGDFVGIFNFYSYSNDLNDVGMKAYLDCLFGKEMADRLHQSLGEESKLYMSMLAREASCKDQLKPLTKEQIFMLRGLV